MESGPAAEVAPGPATEPSTEPVESGPATGATPEPQLPEKHHRNVQGGAARAAVFGVSDGLVSNIAIVLGFAGADPTPSLVRLAGLVGLIGGAVSMAAGEYVSMTAQAELLERELEMERIELRRSPEMETAELAAIYMARGVDRKTAEEMSTQLMRNPELALETHAREELGIDPGELGSPMAASVSSFFSFGVGAIVPLFPWFFGGGTAAVVASIILGTIAAILVGGFLGRFTGRRVLRSALRQLLFTAIPALITFVLGSLAGVGAVG
ncbi:MAG: vacuolar iron transporter family protein [Actinomycetota bacterium]|jgi:VIT1/CCC1 family predicted Fe2+/Mn2+ transporter|nr:vacuolar iron transporter family protein [Actinomycetota bacterium]